MITVAVNNVRLSYGRTVNTGNYESERFELALDMTITGGDAAAVDELLAETMTNIEGTVNEWAAAAEAKGSRAQPRGNGGRGGYGGY